MQVSPINILSCSSDFAFLNAWIQAAGGMRFVCTMPILIDTQTRNPPFLESTCRPRSPTLYTFINGLLLLPEMVVASRTRICHRSLGYNLYT